MGRGFHVRDAAKGRLTKLIHIGLSGDRCARTIVTDSWALIFITYVHVFFDWVFLNKSWFPDKSCPCCRRVEESKSRERGSNDVCGLLD